jgi:hypothetical protein
MANRNNKGQFVKKSAPAKKSVVKAAKSDTKRNAIVIALEKSFPTNTQRVDRSLSKQLKDKGMSSHKGLQFIMMQRKIAEKGKYAGREILAPWPCLEKAVTIKNKINQLVDKYTLDLQVRGNRVCSVHMFETFREELKALDIELRQNASEMEGELGSMKAEDLDRLKNAHDKDGNPVDLSAFYDDSLYPTPAAIRSYGVRMIPTPLQSDFFEGAEDTFKDLEKQKVDRLLERVGNLFVAINDYIQGNAKKFTENTIENLQQEAELLKEMDFGADNEAFEKVCDKAIEIASSVNAPAIREAWNKANNPEVKVKTEKGVRSTVKVDREESVQKDAKKYLDETSDELAKSLEELQESCKGLF